MCSDGICPCYSNTCRPPITDSERTLMSLKRETEQTMHLHSGLIADRRNRRACFNTTQSSNRHHVPELYGLQHYSKLAKCAWGYQTTYDGNRIPSTLTQAVLTSSSSCGAGPNPSACRQDCYCEHVKRFARVMRKHNCRSRDCEFRWTWEALTIGFTCMCDELFVNHVMPDQ